MIKVEDEDLPSIFLAVDGASKRAQFKYLWSIRFHAVLLILGAGLGVVGINSAEAAVFAAVFFLGAIFMSIFIANKKYEEIWYRARAVAESVKTSSWRYMMKADPYWDSPSIAEVRGQFRGLLLKILKEHKDLATEFLSDASAGEAVTETMNKIRALGTAERLETYKEERVEDQRAWYEKKAKYNRRHGTAWFSIFIVLQAAAVICVLGRIAKPEFQNWPVELFVVAASSAFTWIHLKRFRELSAAYTLTAHEISLLKGEAELVSTDTELAEFVRDSESAFSREHTQWVARKE